jgi:hypothetical protein
VCLWAGLREGRFERERDCNSVLSTLIALSSLSLSLSLSLRLCLFSLTSACITLLYPTQLSNTRLTSHPVRSFPTSTSDAHHHHQGEYSLQVHPTLLSALGRSDPPAEDAAAKATAMRRKRTFAMMGVMYIFTWSTCIFLPQWANTPFRTYDTTRPPRGLLLSGAM